MTRMYRPFMAHLDEGRTHCDGCGKEFILWIAEPFEYQKQDHYVCLDCANQFLEKKGLELMVLPEYDTV